MKLLRRRNIRREASFERFWKHSRIEFEMHSSTRAPTRGNLLEFGFRKSLALFTARQTDRTDPCDEKSVGRRRVYGIGGRKIVKIPYADGSEL